MEQVTKHNMTNSMFLNPLRIPAMVAKFNLSQVNSHE